MTARVSWHEARAIAGVAASALPAELVALGSCVGRALVDDLETGIDIPHYASSAMDGWLVVGEGPWELTQGDPLPGQARPIVTGAFVAPTASAVLRSESGAVIGDGTLRSTVAGEPAAGQHIRALGTEAVRGERLIGAGTVLNPAHVALAASAGADALRVHAVPSVALVFTGDEVVTHGVPGPGRVRDSFAVQLPALFALLDGRVTRTSRVGDELERTVNAIDECSEPLIVTTGGTGESSVDHVRAALRALGAEFLVDGIAMRPGGPTSIARLPDSRLVASLPGNPLAAMVAAISICEPLVASLAGRPARQTRTVTTSGLEGRAGSTLLVPYALTDDRVAVVRWLGSGMMRGLAEADGLLVVPGAGTVEGERTESLDLPWRG
ncbi:molybdopterin-binding protein [soil metagenome]